MKLKTSNFGEIEIEESGIITFEAGLPGFEGLKRFALLQDPEMIVDWLQGIDEDVTFPVINPFSIADDYEFKIPEGDIKRLEIKNQEDVLVYTVVIIPENIEGIRTNLQAPVIINRKTRKAKQIILGEEYPMRYEFYQKAGV